MTITRRPPRPATPTAAPLAPRRRKTPESFIEDAQHPAPAIEPPAPVPAPAPEPVAEEKAGKKAKGKKEKSKSKHKAEKIEKAKRKDKEAVLIRFEDEQLAEMDKRAAALGLSRAAWLRMLVSKALRGKKA
jgi:predicted DNA binding CopG/RHH family protein